MKKIEEEKVYFVFTGSSSVVFCHLMLLILFSRVLDVVWF